MKAYDLVDKRCFKQVFANLYLRYSKFQKKYNSKMKKVDIQSSKEGRKERT